MRDIKFRVFNEVTGKMSDVKTMCGRYVWDYGVDPVYDSPQKMIDTAYDIEDKSHLIQFTGLKDKNGKEIYEGDIVRLKSEENDCELISEVKFKSTCFMVDCDGLTFGDYSATSLGFLVEDEVDIEVISNIYEHSHLLK